MSSQNRTDSWASIAAAGSLLILGANVTFAGDVLRLRSGTVRLPEVSESLKSAAKSRLSEGRYFVVQFKDAIQPSDEAAVRDAGLEILGYLPEHAYLVRGEAKRVAALAASRASVHAFSRYEAAWKIAPAAIAAQKGVLRDGMVSYTVSLAKGEDAGSVLTSLRLLPGVGKTRSNGESIIVEAKPTALSAIASLEGVEWIQPTSEMVSLVLDLAAPAEGGQPPASKPAITGFESGTKLVGIEAAYQRGYFGNGEIVGISDTGCDTGDVSTLHADLKSQLLKGYPVGFLNFWWYDAQGHGTHVAGSVVGNGAMSDGKIQGAAPQAKLTVGGLNVPIVDMLIFPQDFNKITGPAYDAGARIHSNSWGAASPLLMGEYETYAQKADQYMWDHPDLLLLFAAGNSGVDANRDGRIDPNSIGTPATAKNVLTVGASENVMSDGGIQKTQGELRDGDKNWGIEPIKSGKISDNANGIAMFSSRGPTKDGRLKPDVVAPGTNIVSTRSKHKKATVLWGEYDANYVWAGGTSMATPITAGSAALVREFLKKGRGIANPSGSLLKAVLIHTAVDLFPGQYGEGTPTQELLTRRPNTDEGYGRINVAAATGLAADRTLIVDEATGVVTGAAKTYTVEVGEGGSLIATMTYTDAPGTPASGKALVNDLALSVTGPNGQVYEKLDSVNNTEMLELSGLAAGTYTVSVKGAAVPMGKNGAQPFALVVTR